MRTIKFRGKREDNGEWVYGAFYPIKDEDVFFIINNCKSIDFDDNNTAFNGHKVHKKSVGQFTGIRDKNGKDIYEGDVIKKCGYNKKEIQWIKYYRVIYEYDAFCLEKDGETYAFGFSKDGKLIKEEIIGNIHEHNFLLDEN